MVMPRVLLSLVAAWVLIQGAAFGQIDARMLRQPHVSDTHITFVYAGDIWLVPREGGTAHRLSSPEGEESFPRFSPDGKEIAFSANYDGNVDVYVVSSSGGTPRRLTHHPMEDRLLGWYPDGQHLLIASSMESGRQRFNQLFKVDRRGGLPEKLPVPFGEFGALSPDGRVLAFMMRTRDFRTWKRYRGGMAPDIWLFDLETYESENVTQGSSNDAHPMWREETLYFLSDRGPEKRYNIWAYDRNSGQHRQVTEFRDFDVHFPSIGPRDIVFEAGGRLYLLDLETERHREVVVRAVTDERMSRPRSEKVESLIQTADISPSGRRAVFGARGEILTVPAEHGFILNLTRDSAVAERYPSWSPDGAWVAFWSDRSGEYELTVRAADGSGGVETLTSLGPGFRYTPRWSPDSRKLAFADNRMRIQIFDRDSGTVVEVDQAQWMFHGGLSAFDVSWSADSRWMAYHRDTEHRARAVFLYDFQNRRRHQVTSAYYDEFNPVFDPDGKYLYFLTNREFTPSYSSFDNTWVYANSSRIAAVPLRKDVASPLAPRNDADDGEDKEGRKDKEGEEDQEGKEGKEEQEEQQGQEGQKGKEEDRRERGDEKTAPVEIDLDGFESRIVLLPPAAGNYGGLSAAKGRVVYQRNPRTGEPSDTKSRLVFYDLKEREEKEVVVDLSGYRLSADGKKALVRRRNTFAIVDLQPNQEIKKTLRTGELEAEIDPRAEWRQIFVDAWRLQRDFFYDPNLHGVDWEGVKERYGRLLEDCATRWDVNYVIGEMIAELDASHTYRGGGDLEHPKTRGVGLLGVDWSLENGAYRVKRIVRGASWDAEVRSPLDEPGVDVEEGDYILAVNGVPLDTTKDPWASFQGLEEKTVQLTVNDRPATEGSRNVLVTTLASETRLRHLEWIEANRRRVEEAGGGRVGYVYVRSTGLDGQSELARQFYAQFTKEGLIIDERFNSGGQIPDRFIELLNRRPLSFWAVRDGRDWQWPPVAHFGPKVMLINGWSGSGGDAFPFYFREAGLGPLIGTTTWGGLIGMTGTPSLVDGGMVTAPTFRMYGVDGEWFPEGRGVTPDIEVVENPTEMARGRDPQLERAIEEVLDLIARRPPPVPRRPAYEDRSN
jgi:tricorn protease